MWKCEQSWIHVEVYPSFMLTSPFDHKQRRRVRRWKMWRRKIKGEATGRQKPREKRQSLRGWTWIWWSCLSQSHFNLTAATNDFQALFYTLVFITQLINRRPVTVSSKKSHTHKHTLHLHVNSTITLCSTNQALTPQTLTVVPLPKFHSVTSPFCYQGNKAYVWWSVPSCFIK